MRVRYGLSGLMVGILLVATGCASRSAGPGAEIGQDGRIRVHPFSEERQALLYLRAARVVHSQAYQDGVNLNSKLVLEHEGVRTHAILRQAHDVEAKPFRVGSRVMYFRDSFLGEVAAYELNRMLGMNNLPPTVMRTFQGKPGAVQLWLEGTMTEHERLTRNLSPPDPDRWKRQLGDMRVFDNLINNTDRHPKNFLIDTDWNLWLIDHTRAFGKDPYLPLPYSMTTCSKELWRALNRLEAKQVRERLQPCLSTEEIDALLIRHTKLLAHLRRRLKISGSQAEIRRGQKPSPL